MSMISLSVQGSAEHVRFDVPAIAIAGYTGRDQASVQRHIDELRAQGIPAPKATPVLFAATADRLTQDVTIDVVGGSTSGEAEFVLITNEQDETFVTIGSDHTDRELEKADIPGAKQAVPKIVGSEAWKLSDVEDHWDEIEIRSWVAGRPAPYQEGLVSALMPPRDIIRFVATRSPGSLRDVVIFSGTLPLSTPTFIAADRFKAELTDPVLRRRLSIEYAVHAIGWKTDP